MSNNKPFSGTMLVLMLVMLINALSYGVIIPLLYPYASRFGINPTGLSFLFASYSLLQFIATPLIGRLSDRFGRKPLLIISLIGSAISLAAFALASNIFQLFLARMIDGITGGNVSVAQAVIADTQKPADRAKAFGMLGAAFGFGFMVGPGIGGLLSRFGLTTPFWFAAGLSVVGVLMATFFLPETNKNRGEKPMRRERVIDIPKLWHALWAPTTGVLLMITLFASIGQNAFVIGFQSVTVDLLKLTAFQVGIIFTVFGLVNVLMQGFGIRYLLKIASSRNLLLFALGGGVVLVGLLGFATTLPVFSVFLAIYMFIPPAAPFLSGLISLATKNEDQGGMLGLSQAYTSIGQVIGPLLAGFVTRWYVPGAFWVAAVIWLIATILVTKVPRVSKAVDL